MSSHRLLHRCRHVAGFEDALLPDLNPQESGGGGEG
jgi:hypothetical protein